MLVIVKYDEDQGQLTNILKCEYTLCMFYLMLQLFHFIVCLLGM